MDESRRQFEEYVSNRYPVIHRMFEREGDGYALPSTNEMWLLWQASRQAIEIDLTDWFSPNDGGDKAVWVDQIEKQFMAKGLKIKEVP